MGPCGRLIDYQEAGTGTSGSSVRYSSGGPSAPIGLLKQHPPQGTTAGAAPASELVACVNNGNKFKL